MAMTADSAAAWQAMGMCIAAAVLGFAVLVARRGELDQGTKGGPSRVLLGMGLESALVLRLLRANRSHGLTQDADRMGIPLKFLNASDGLRDSAFLSRVMPLSLPESTCADIIGAIFDTHERAWAIAASGERPVLVLEDDVRLPNNFAEALGRRMKELPEGYHMAFAGTSVTRNARRVSALVSRPDADDVNKQALLGIWAYVVTPKGALRLLDLAKRARRSEKRLFQPVDLFVAHRLKEIQAYVFEPTPELASAFEEDPDRHHVLETMRQVGIVKLDKKSESVNTHAQDDESAEMQKKLNKVVVYGNDMQYVKSWKLSWKALRKMRRYSCWSAGPLLQNAALSLLNLLQSNANGPTIFGGANQTLLASMEAFASTIRYSEGTWMEGKKLGEYSSWTRYALSMRTSRGLSAIAPPRGWEERVPLPCGGWLDPKTPALVESAVQCAGERSEPSLAAGASAAPSPQPQWPPGVYVDANAPLRPQSAQ